MNNDIYILSVETSCDETSVAIFKNRQLLSHIITSSATHQSLYGGVVPEIASRYHEKNIVDCYLKAIKQANINQNQLTHIAYTAFPGLPGSLHVGKVFAKTIATILNIKCIEINHLHAHIFSATINNQITFPTIGLVLSGGETCLYLVRDFDDITTLNQTKDDAIGECYDKVAKVLGWKYPGGPVIDSNFDESKATISFIKPNPPYQDFSFSGLKTAIINYVHNLRQKNQEIDKIAVASSFQKFVIDDVIKKTKYYLDFYNLDSLIIGGGVCANRFLRKRLMGLAKTILIPQIIYCGDNAAMIGIYAYHLILNNKKSILIK